MRSGFFKTSAPSKTSSARPVGKENAKLEATSASESSQNILSVSGNDQHSVTCQQLGDLPSATATSPSLPPAVAAAQPLVAELDPITWKKNFDQCLLLLKGPEDEKR